MIKKLKILFTRKLFMLNIIIVQTRITTISEAVIINDIMCRNFVFMFIIQKYCVTLNSCYVFNILAWQDSKNFASFPVTLNNNEN